MAGLGVDGSTCGEGGGDLEWESGGGGQPATMRIRECYVLLRRRYDVQVRDSYIVLLVDLGL